jgi:transposase-like protein
MEFITNCSVCNAEQRFKPGEILVGRVFRCKKCEESFEITSVDYYVKSAIFTRLKNGQEIINDLKKVGLM